jgi:hypothetical protein
MSLRISSAHAQTPTTCRARLRKGARPARALETITVGQEVLVLTRTDGQWRVIWRTQLTVR